MPALGFQVSQRVKSPVFVNPATRDAPKHWCFFSMALLIAGSEGVQYSVRDMTALDRASRRLLERFL